MQGRKAQPPKLIKQNPKKQNNNPNHNSDISDHLFDAEMTSQNHLQSHQIQHPQTGRHGSSEFENERRRYKSNTNVVFSQLFDVMAKGYMKVFKNLFEGVESWQILQFLNSYREFLTILKLLIDDHFLALETIDFQQTNFNRDFLYEPVPRTFICGLIKMRQHKKLSNPTIPLGITETQIKALYISSLLLIGVGQIDGKHRVKGRQESQQCYFHKIVNYLLDQSAFLTPKLFYYISGNWSRITQIIKTQIEVDLLEGGGEQKVQKKQPSISKELNLLRIEQNPEILQIPYQRQRDEYQIDGQPFEIIRSNHERNWDLPWQFLSESKPKQKMEEVISVPIYEQQNKNMKRTQPTVLFQGNLQTQKKRKLDSLADPAIKKAIKHYNYMKFHTRDRTKNKTFHSKNNSRNQPMSEANEEVLEQQNKEEKLQIQPQPCFYFEDSYENYFLNDERERYSFRKKDSIQSLDFIFSQTLRSSSSDEDKKMSSQQLLPSHQREAGQQSGEENVMEVESDNARLENPNRSVCHENREIDYMISCIIQDRFVMIHSIANQIYHSLRMANVKLVDSEGFTANES